MNRVAIIATSGFKRMAPHIGAHMAYAEEERRGRVPKPVLITGSSAGAITSAVIFPRTKERFDYVVETILNLKKSQIFNRRHLAEVFVVLTLGESFMNFIPQWEKERLSPWLKLIVESGKTGLSLGTKVALFREILRQPSLLSSAPLQHLLLEKLKFQAIRSSDIKLEIPAVDIEAAETVIFTNYLDKHRQLPDWDVQLVDAIRASASVVAFLPVIKMGGRILDDAALLDNLPIHRAIAAGCDTAFLLLHTPYYESAPIKDGKINWIEELTRALDLLIGRSTELTVERYRRINQDLAVMTEIKSRLNELKCRHLAASKSQENLDLAVELSAIENLHSGYNAYGEKPIQLIPVVCEPGEKIPDLNFRHFDRESLRQGLEIGYNSMKRVLSKI